MAQITITLDLDEAGEALTPNSIKALETLLYRLVSKDEGSPIKGVTVTSKTPAATKPALAAVPNAPAQEELDLVTPTNEDEKAQAVAFATKMVADGKTGDLKTALAAVGAKRVSDLQGADLTKFLADVTRG